MPFAQFDRSQLNLLPLHDRIHDLDVNVDIKTPETYTTDFDHPTLDKLADAIRQAKAKKAAILLMMGGHVIRSGVAPFLMRMMDEGYVTHFALNGAAAIHDFELAMEGGSSESVAKYISEGQFGLWQETGQLNEAAKEAHQEGLGFGEAAGRWVERNNFPNKDISLLAGAYRAKVPLTIHVGIGNDIIHEHPNCDGAALGAASYTDFLIYTQTVANLENGVFLNFGSAVTGPEVYLKALAMARNVAIPKGQEIVHFTTAVFDLLDLEGNDFSAGTPPKSDPRYYFRPWKTILSRTVSDGGTGYYVQGLHQDTIPCLYHKLFD